MDQSLFNASEVLVANSFILESFLWIRNMNDKKLVFGNYSYILEKLKFLRNFVFMLVL